MEGSGPIEPQEYHAGEHLRRTKGGWTLQEISAELGYANKSGGHAGFVSKYQAVRRASASSDRARLRSCAER